MILILSRINDSFEQKIRQNAQIKEKRPRTASFEGGEITFSLNESKNKIGYIYNFIYPI